jgi:hypothetical protein
MNSPSEEGMGNSSGLLRSSASGFDHGQVFEEDRFQMATTTLKAYDLDSCIAEIYDQTEDVERLSCCWRLAAGCGS